jgi:hypothetical protein
MHKFHIDDEIIRRIEELENKRISEITGEEMLELDQLTADVDGRKLSIPAEVEDYYEEEEYEWR